jgi:hypothetical protein
MAASLGAGDLPVYHLSGKAIASAIGDILKRAKILCLQFEEYLQKWMPGLLS